MRWCDINKLELAIPYTRISINQIEGTIEIENQLLSKHHSDNCCTKSH